MRSADMDRERERRRWEDDAQRGNSAEDAAQARRDERVQVLSSLGQTQGWRA